MYQFSLKLNPLQQKFSLTSNNWGKNTVIVKRVDYLSLRSVFCPFLSGCLRQVLLYFQSEWILIRWLWAWNRLPLEKNCLVVCKIEEQQRHWSGIFLSVSLLCQIWIILGRAAQQVMCLAADACLTANPGVASLIPVRSHTFVKIEHEISPPFCSIKKGWLVVSYKRSMCPKYWLTAWSSLPRKRCGEVKWSSQHDHSCWLGRKATNQTNKQCMKIPYLYDSVWE